MCKWIGLCIALEQGKADFGELAAQGDQGSRAAQTADSQPLIVRRPQVVAPGLHGGVEQQPPDLAIALLGKLASALPAAGSSNPRVEPEESDGDIDVGEVAAMPGRHQCLGGERTESVAGVLSREITRRGRVD